MNEHVKVKFFYFDEGDVISVSSDDNLKIMQESENLSALKLYVFSCLQKAQQFLNYQEANNQIGRHNVKDIREVVAQILQGNNDSAPQIMDNKIQHQKEDKQGLQNVENNQMEEINEEQKSNQKQLNNQREKFLDQIKPINHDQSVKNNLKQKINVSDQLKEGANKQEAVIQKDLSVERNIKMYQKSGVINEKNSDNQVVEQSLKKPYNGYYEPVGMNNQIWNQQKPKRYSDNRVSDKNKYQKMTCVEQNLNSMPQKQSRLQQNSAEVHQKKNLGQALVKQQDDLVKLQREILSINNIPSEDQQPKLKENNLYSASYYSKQASYMDASGQVQQQFAGDGAGYGQQYYNQFMPQAYGVAGGYQMPNQNNLNSSINNMNSNAYQFQPPVINFQQSPKQQNQNQLGRKISTSNLIEANKTPMSVQGLNAGANANFQGPNNFDNFQIYESLSRQINGASNEEFKQQTKLAEYQSQVNSIMSKQLKESMRQLGEMGYLDFKRNEDQLKKHNSNVEKALMELLGD
eukprot:403335587